MITLLAAPALLPLVITVVNLLTWRPVTATVSVPRGVSALVPARNEEATIGACVASLLAEPFDEVVVLDDNSTDATPRILTDLARREPRLRVLSGRPLPPGWVGKPHACAQLAEAATGDIFVFVDADVVFRPRGLARLAARLERSAVVTALPAQRTGSPFEALVIAQLHLVYASWLPLALVRLVRDPRVLSANGQVLAVHRAAYERFGGFPAVRSEIVDDLAFCRAAKVAGEIVDFVDGEAIAACRMYRSDRAAWEGFSKNVYEGLGSPLALALAAGLHVACFLLPWALLPVAPVAALVGVAANLLQRALLARWFGHPWWTVVAHPVGVGLLLAVAGNSWWWSRGDRLQWRGRTYVARARRAPAEAGDPVRPRAQAEVAGGQSRGAP